MLHPALVTSSSSLRTEFVIIGLQEQVEQVLPMSAIPSCFLSPILRYDKMRLSRNCHGTHRLMLGLIQMPPQLGCVRCPDECFLLMSGNAGNELHLYPLLFHSFSTPFPLLFHSFSTPFLQVWVGENVETQTIDAI